MMKITALYERTCQPDAENIRRQKNNLTNIAKQYGLGNIQHFTDDGYSCSDETRPGFTALMNAIRAGQVGVLVIRDCSRLTRDHKTFADLLSEFDQHGVRLIAPLEKTDRLPLHSHNDDNGLDYELHGDFYFPLLIVPKTEEAPTTGKWTDQYLDYLKENRPVLFNRLVVTGKLNSHLAEIDKQARERFLTLMDAYKEKWNISEELKAQDVMRWIQLMNNARNEAEWNVMQEIVFG